LLPAGDWGAATTSWSRAICTFRITRTLVPHAARGSAEPYRAQFAHVASPSVLTDTLRPRMQIYQQLGRNSFAATLRSELGHALAVFGRLDEAASHFQAAAKLLIEVGVLCAWPSLVHAAVSTPGGGAGRHKLIVGFAVCVICRARFLQPARFKARSSAW